MIVTIDGPAGAGKSTVARRLAQELGFDYLDTGAMYRMVALAAVEAQLDPQSAAAMEGLLHDLQLEFRNEAAYLNGRDVSGLLRSLEVSRAASLVAQHPCVRTALVDRQREIAQQRSIVSDGRDQGTIVFPHAERKFFLTADPQTRAERRQSDLREQGVETELEELLREQQARDERDAARAIAPLRPAEDALLIDTTQLDLSEVVALLQRHVRNAPPPGNSQIDTPPDPT